MSSLWKVYEKKIMFDFTKEEYEEIKDRLMLNDEMAEILEMKIKGCTIVEIAFKLHLSTRTIDRRISKLKKKITKIL